MKFSGSEMEENIYSVEYSYTMKMISIFLEYFKFNFGQAEHPENLQLEIHAIRRLKIFILNLSQLFLSLTNDLWDFRIAKTIEYFEEQILISFWYFKNYFIVFKFLWRDIFR